MSSHHIVRENQEPALIIANGESCSSELLDGLLEWSPYTVVLDGALHRVLELGIRFDALLGDFDRLGDFQEQVKHMQPLDIVHTPDQNKTDLEKGIEYLLNRGFNAVNIVWATGRRADHTITNITDLARYKEKINAVIWDDYSKIYVLPAHFEKWYTAGSVISLIPVGVVEGINSKGLKYNLSNDKLEIGFRTGSSNEALEDGIVQISHTSGHLLMMECHD